MMEPEEIAAVLAGTWVADLPIVAGYRGTIVIRDVPPDRLLDAWQTTYQLLPATGRWPVLVTLWDDDRSVLLPRFGWDAPDEAELSSLDRAARTTDPWAHFLRYDDRAVTDEASWISHSYWLGLDLGDELLREADPPATTQTLDRWIYERVIADPALTARIAEGARRAVQTDCWFTPDNVSLVLLPTALSWLAPKWVSFFGALAHNEEFAAVLWQWDQQWGARLVACWDTMLQFIVERPPNAGDDAWMLARQIKGLASNLEMEQWRLAVALPEGTAWFIHNRP